MKKKVELKDIVFECHREVYSFIGVDFDKLHSSGVTKRENWFSDFHLDHSKQEEIVNKVLNRYRLKPYEKKQVSIAIWLGGFPSYVENPKVLKEYKEVLASGMFWEWFPNYSGNWADDEELFTRFYYERVANKVLENVT